MTVGELRIRMSHDEFIHWAAFFAVRKERADREARRQRKWR
jgi:hypothetical protein